MYRLIGFSTELVSHKCMFNNGYFLFSVQEKNSVYRDITVR